MTTDTNVQNLIINILTKEQYESIANPSSTELYLTPDDDNTSRNIGEIVASTIPLTDAGLHLLDGALIDGNGIYADFVDYISNLDLTANYFCTEAEWQQSVTDYGVCGKFVYDSVNNTVRLPKYNSKIYTGGGEAPVVGNGKTLGLTDGLNTYGIYSQSGDYARFVGNTNLANVNAGTGTSGQGNMSRDVALGITNNETESGIIAQLSNITTLLDGYYYIVIATSTKTDIQVDIDEIATDLNGKVDKADLQEVQCVVETYQNGSSWYRVYSDGWCEQGGHFDKGSLAKDTTNTITLLKPFVNINYTLIALANRNDNSGGSINNQVFVIYRTTNSFIARCYGDGNSQYIDWQASGYIEV